VIDVTASETILAPREEVARYVMDHRNDAAWIGGIKESELLGDAPFRVGSDVRRAASFLGKRIEYVNRVDELEPGRRLVMRSVKSPFPMVLRYSFEDEADGSTRASVRVQGEPSAIYAIAGPVLSRQVHRSVSRDLRTLRRLVPR
jgi:Polyketide cyclase / dehydrase and lipid transport